MKSLSAVSKRQQVLAEAGSGAWWVRLWTALIWGGIGWSIVYWVLRLGGDALPSPGRELVAADAPIGDARTVARALGGSDTVGQGMSAIGVMAARYRLLGVAVGDGRGHGSELGLALISVDGQPARPYRLSAVMPNGEQVLELARSSAVLRLSDGQELRLQVPDPQMSSPSQPPQIPSASSASVDLPSNPVISMPAATQQAELQSQHETSDTSARREEMRATVYANRLSRRSAEEQPAQTAP